MSIEKIETTLINKDLNALNELPKNARIILVVGGDGSGKTSVIHTFLNLYEKNLSIEDSKRFQLTGTQKKEMTEYGGVFKETNKVQAYVISNPEDPEAPLVFIDTPPLGLLPNNKEMIIDYLKQHNLPIDAILVAFKSTTTRITPEDKAVIASVNKLKSDYLTGSSLFMASTFSTNSAGSMPSADSLCLSLDINKEHMFYFDNTPLNGALDSASNPFYELSSSGWGKTKESVTSLAKKFLALPHNPKIKENSNSETSNTPTVEKKGLILINKEVNSLGKLPKNARIILVVGSAGSGKTNIIHNFLNIYEKKLSLDDPNKFQLAGTQKKVVTEYGGPFEATSKIQAYLISNPEDEEAPLVFIDTPPFDDRVAKDYLEAINNYLGDQQSGIDGILYTIDNSTERLGVKERNAFTLVKQLKDKYLIGDSLFVASTNADLMGLRCVPLLKDALETETGGIFNFCINPLKKASKNPNIHRMQSADWERSTKSLNNLAKKLETLPKNTRTRENSNPKALNKTSLTDASSIKKPAVLPISSDKKVPHEPETTMASLDTGNKTPSSTHSYKDQPRLSEIPLNTPVSDIITSASLPTSEPVTVISSTPASLPIPEPVSLNSTPASLPTSEHVKSEINSPNSPKVVTPAKTGEAPSNKTLPVQNDKTQKPALSHFNMSILSGFITVLGIAMVAIAFTLLNAATGGVAGVALASVGACTLLLGVGLFFKNRANPKLPEPSESPAVRPV